MINSRLFWAVAALSVTAYWLAPRRYRAYILAGTSAGYVGWIAPFSAAMLAVWTLLFYYGAGPGLPEVWRRRRARLLSVIGAAGVLFYFKYSRGLFAAAGLTGVERDVVIPLGISYYTFKLIHYAVESGRGAIGRHGLTEFVNYMFLYPIFTAGPIERFDGYLKNREVEFRRQHIVQGVYRIIAGFIKKFLVAETLIAAIPIGSHTVREVDGFFAASGDMAPYRIWAYLFITYLYYYFDFSAYSDFAIGISRLYGLRIMENFNLPILAATITDYWRRWHISLSRWCQTYVYMPVLGLWRRPGPALYASFIVMGLWHEGTAFRLCWGAYHATGVLVYAEWSRLKRRRKWQGMPEPLATAAGFAATQIFVAGSMVFQTFGPGHGASGALRVLARALALPL